MKSLLFVLAAITAFGQEPLKNVYILPMPGGMDQFLALRLTQERVMQVVTDPQKAELILTDRIGGDFEQTMSQLYGAATPVENQDPFNFARPNMRPLATTRGAVFLVDRNSRNVLGSWYEQPRDTSPGELNRAARKLVDRMADQLK